MKKFLSLFFICLSISIGFAQSYTGYLWDNYSGIHGIIQNPANIANSKFRADINLFSGSVGAYNDAYKIDVIKNLSGVITDNATTNFTRDNNLYVNVDVLGPSFMFNIKPNHSIALSTRFRSMFNATAIDGKFIDDLDNQTVNNLQNLSISNQNTSFATNSWTELGLSYGFVAFNRNKHFFKGGLTAKYLTGFANAYIKANNVNINYTDTNIETTSLYQTSGTIEAGNVRNLNNIDNIDDLEGKGFGADLGFIYEYRPNGTSGDAKVNDYKFKIGLSITDIGAIKYDNSEERTYDLNRDVNGLIDGVNTEFDVENNDIEDLFFTQKIENNLTAKLPTALHLNGDWNINQRFYLNFNTSLGLVSKDKKNANFINNMASLTPRYEKRWLGLYLPLSVSEISGFQSGFGFRIGPLFAGSGSIISNLATKTGFADVYAGIKIPIFKSNKKNEVEVVKEAPVEEITGEIQVEESDEDTDKDGVFDRDDKCKLEFGAKENYGCPWPDTDKDGVLDKDDKCFTEPGVRENKGCPWPDSDKDGVLDKDDNCPSVFGEKNNAGCPKINNEVVKKLNAYTKSVLFDSGKSTIKEVSNATLDEMVKIMKEYPTAKFSLEGHTDAAGKAVTNQKLSEERASAIKNYLIANGIDSNRLISKGFGATKPIASNTTTQGKAQNRRVEIKLVE